MKRQIPQRKATENEAKSGRKRTRSKRNEIDCADDDFKPSNSVKKSPVAVKQKNKAMGLNWTIEEKTNQAPVSDGMCHEEKGSLDYCPICQFPFKYLVGQNEDWHVSDCLTSRGTTPSQGECPNGLKCHSISQEHFRRYGHSAQAISRSKVSLSVENETYEIQGKMEFAETSTVTKALDQDCRENANELKSVDPSNMDELGSKILNKSLGSNSCISDKSMNSSYEKILSEIVDELETESCGSSTLEDVCKNHKLQQANDKAENAKSHLNIMEVGIETDFEANEGIDASESHSSTASNSKPSNISTNSDSIKNNSNFLEKSNSAHCSSQGSGSSDSSSVIFINDASESSSTISKNPTLTSDSGSSSNSKQMEPTTNLSGAQNISAPNDSKKLRQTGIGNYFGAKSTGAAKIPTVNTILRREPISKFDQSKAGKKESASSGADGNKSGKRSYGNSGKPKICPFYKKIPGTSITVDAFSYGTIPDCDAYFLSHFHYDHYGGLKKTFSQNMYCSKITAALVRMQIKVDSKYITELPMNEEVDVNGVTVILLDANHCPGSVMFLFTLQGGKKILHTGDFRAIQTMADHTPLQNIRMDALYLDTTYCNPSYNFPTQQSTVDFAVEKAVQAVERVPKTLIVSGTYSIGKERVFVSIAKALDCKICANTSKQRILNCLEWDELADRLTTNWSLAKVHVLPMNHINVTSLESHLSKHKGFQKVVAFKPTGWTFNQRATDLDLIRPTVSGNVTIYGVPYSEHSSFSELQWFVQHFKPSKIIPTVNVGSPVKREEMQNLFKEWLSS